MRIEGVTFGSLPAQMTAWVAARAFRRVLPFVDKCLVRWQGNECSWLHASRRVILQTELFAYERQTLDDTWFPNFRDNIRTLYEEVNCRLLFYWVGGLRELKPRFRKSTLGCGNVSGNFLEALWECKEALWQLQGEGRIYGATNEELVAEWLLHLNSDISYYTELALSFDARLELLRKCTLSELGSIFCYLPDSYEEQGVRDSEYQRPLFADNSLLQQVEFRVHGSHR